MTDIAALNDKLYLLSHLCGLNQRYFQQANADALAEANHLAIAIAAITLIGMIATAISYFNNQSSTWTRRASLASLIFGIAAVALSMFLKVHPIADQVQQYSELYIRWSDLRIDVDAVMEEAASTKDPSQTVLDDYWRLYREYQTKKNELISLERFTVDKSILEKSWQDENEARTGFRTDDPNEPKRTGAEYDENGNPRSKTKP